MEYKYHKNKRARITCDINCKQRPISEQQQHSHNMHISQTDLKSKNIVYTVRSPTVKTCTWWTKHTHTY